MRQPEVEAISPEELELLQLERLQSTLTRAYRQVKFYRRRFDEAGLTPESIQSLRRPGPAAPHHPGGSFGELPLRPLCPALKRHRPHHLVPGHHGPAPGGGLLQPGRQTVAGTPGPPLHRGRGDPGGHRATGDPPGAGQLAPGPHGRGGIPRGLGHPRGHPEFRQGTHGHAGLQDLGPGHHPAPGPPPHHRHGPHGPQPRRAEPQEGPPGGGTPA